MYSLAIKTSCGSSFILPREDFMSVFRFIIYFFLLQGFFLKIKAIPHNDCCANAPSDFRQTIPIEETRAAPRPTKFVKYDGKMQAKATTVHPAVLP